MLTSLSRAVARGALASVPARRGLVASVAARRGVWPAASVRGFAGSAWVRAPAASAATATKKKQAAAKGTKTKKAAATKAAKKKKTTAAAGEKKAAAPKKKKKKAAAKKRRTKRRFKRRPMTPEQRARAKLRYLKLVSLYQEPPRKPSAPWQIYMAENMPRGSVIPIAEKTKKLSEDFGKLSVADLQKLENKAASNRAVNKQRRETWIRSFPVEVVYLANLARHRLGRLLKRRRVYLVHDKRMPKRPTPAYLHFVKARFGELEEGTKPRKAMTELGLKWRALSDDEKKPFYDLAQADAQRLKGQFSSYIGVARAYWKNNMPRRKTRVPLK